MERLAAATHSADKRCKEPGLGHHKEPLNEKFSIKADIFTQSFSEVGGPSGSAQCRVRVADTVCQTVYLVAAEHRADSNRQTVGS